MKTLFLSLTVLLLSGLGGGAIALTESPTTANEVRPFAPVEQPLAAKIGVGLVGVGLIGLELWWFLGHRAPKLERE